MTSGGGRLKETSGGHYHPTEVGENEIEIAKFPYLGSKVTVGRSVEADVQRSTEGDLRWSLPPDGGRISVEDGDRWSEDGGRLCNNSNGLAALLRSDGGRGRWGEASNGLVVPRWLL